MSNSPSDLALPVDCDPTDGPPDGRAGDDGSGHGSKSRFGRECPRVAVIGGGFTGAMTAAHLLRFAGRPIEVVLFEPRAEAGRGLAYSTIDEGHLLNVPAGRMGAWPDDIGGFHRWASARITGVCEGAFLPRGSFGQYVTEQLDHAASAARSGVRLVRIADSVAALHVQKDGVQIRGEQVPLAIDVDHVVLALGSGPPRRPAPFHDADAPFQRSGRILHPFDQTAMNRITMDDRVLVVGTGLTMFDVAVSLERRGFRGQMTAISRRGRMPLPHRAHDVPAFVKDWAASLVDRGMSDHIAALVRQVRAAVHLAQSAGADWRGVVDAMRPHLPALWGGLPRAERARFVSRIAAYWDVHRHRCAPQIASTIDRMLADGRLIVRAGRVRSVEANGKVFHVQVTPRGGDVEIRHDADHIVLCAGPECDVTQWRTPLMRQLLADDIVTADDLRLGVRTSAEGHPLNASGDPNPRITVVGPLRKADLWESTAVPELRGQAKHASEQALRALHVRERSVCCE